MICLSKTQFFSEIHVIALFYPYEPSSYSWNNIKIQALGLPQQGWLKNALSLRKAYRAVKTQVLKTRPALIHSFWFRQSAIIGQKVSTTFNIPHLCTLMGQDVLKTRYWKRYIPLKTPPLIAVSENQKSFCELEVARVIPWGVSPSVIGVGINESEYDVIGVGSLIAIKSFDRFIDVIQILKQQHPKIKSIIIGDGPEREALQKKIKTSELEENIYLAGHLSRKETIDIMSRSKMLLHTSKFESFCMAIAEALSLGLFTISGPVGIAGEQGHSFIANTDQEIVNTILSIFKLKQHESQGSQYSVERTTRQYLQVYSELMKN